MNRETLIARLTATLLAEPTLLAAWLFGSRARGDGRADSDVDVAVLATTPLTYERLSDLECALDAALHLDPQVVDLRSAPCDLVHRVLRDGCLLFDRDPEARARVEVARRNEFFDLQPYLIEYRLGAPGPA